MLPLIMAISGTLGLMGAGKWVGRLLNAAVLIRMVDSEYEGPLTLRVVIDETVVYGQILLLFKEELGGRVKFQLTPSKARRFVSLMRPLEELLKRSETEEEFVRSAIELKLLEPIKELVNELEPYDVL